MVERDRLDDLDTSGRIIFTYTYIVFGRSCDRPSRHRFFLVSLCLKSNAEMVPKIPSCHYMLLI